MKVRLRLESGGIAEGGGRRSLVQQRDDQKQKCRCDDDGAEMRVNQKHRNDKERRHRGIEKGKQRARHQEGAELLQIAQRLILPPIAVECCPGCRAKDRSPELGSDLNRGPHQDHAANAVENRLQQHRTDDQGGQHHQRVERAAGEHPVRNLEQIHRDGEYEDVGYDREDHHDHQVLPDRLDAGPEACGKIDRSEAFVEDAPSASAAAIAARRAAAIAGGPLVGLDGTAIAIDHDHARRRALLLHLGRRPDNRPLSASLRLLLALRRLPFHRYPIAQCKQGFRLGRCLVLRRRLDPGIGLGSWRPGPRCDAGCLSSC
ncbi:hypothetical protein D9M70_459190 [compost metagenome]